jgi:hypothetical protein
MAVLMVVVAMVIVKVVMVVAVTSSRLSARGARIAQGDGADPSADELMCSWVILPSLGT